MKKMCYRPVEISLTKRSLKGEMDNRTTTERKKTNETKWHGGDVLSFLLSFFQPKNSVVIVFLNLSLHIYTCECPIILYETITTITPNRLAFLSFGDGHVV